MSDQAIVVLFSAFVIVTEISKIHSSGAATDHDIHFCIKQVMSHITSLFLNAAVQMRDIMLYNRLQSADKHCNVLARDYFKNARLAPN